MFAPNPQVDTTLDDVVSNLDISIQPNLSLICIHLDKKFVLYLKESYMWYKIEGLTNLGRGGVFRNPT